MAPLNIKASDACQYDLVSLGEVMLRLDPGEGRIKSTREFRVWEGGGEYNVARGLRRCFRKRTAIVTALADNDIGRLIEDLILQGGVDTQFIRWEPYDGIGRSVRNGLNFTERGFGPRGAIGVSDRGHSAASQLQPADIDWDHLFGDLGVRWFHTGGIFAALSPMTADVVEVAMKTAKEHGTIISYDLNFRPSLWREFGGTERAMEVNRRLAGYVDVMIGNEEDFSAALGFAVPGVDEHFAELETSGFAAMIEEVSATYPSMNVIATTLRTVRSASRNDWSAVGWSRDTGFLHGPSMPNLEILDRVGGGDSFASGLAYGLLEGLDLPTALAYGVAHGALAMSTPGDTSMASLAEVRAIVQGGTARVQR